MAHEVLLPQWGMEMEEATIVRWIKKQGEEVKAGEPLLEVETPKLTSEIEATVSGVVAHIMVPEGETVPCQTLLAIIAAPGEHVPRPASSPRPIGPRAAPPGVKPAPRPITGPVAARPAAVPRVQITPLARQLAQQHGVDLGSVQGTGPGGRITDADVRRAITTPSATAAAPLGVTPSVAAPPAPTAPSAPLQVVPAARRLAQEHGVDLQAVRGTGPGGRITEADVQAAVAARSAAVQPAATTLAGIRKTIADRMMESTLTMAAVTLTTTVDMTDALELRNARPWSGARPSPLHIVVRATARALRDHPRLNASLRDYELTVYDHINIGVAVAISAGLIVPVIKHTDRLKLHEVEQTVRDLVQRAQQGKLKPDDLSGGTFTITTLAPWDVEAFTPIINPPQVAILGMGKIAEQPAVHQRQIAVRSLMVLSLTFNHRALDGVPAAEFLRKLKGYLQQPAWIFE